LFKYFLKVVHKKTGSYCGQLFWKAGKAYHFFASLDGATALMPASAFEPHTSIQISFEKITLSNFGKLVRFACPVPARVKDCRFMARFPVSIPYNRIGLRPLLNS
jgi:hypothetical protein